MSILLTRHYNNAKCDCVHNVTASLICIAIITLYLKSLRHLVWNMVPPYVLSYGESQPPYIVPQTVAKVHKVCTFAVNSQILQMTEAAKREEMTIQKKTSKQGMRTRYNILVRSV